MSIKKLNIDNVKIFNDAINLSLEKLYDLIEDKNPNIFCLDNFVPDKELNKAGYQVYRTLLYDQIFEEQREESQLFGSDLHSNLSDNGFIQIDNFLDPQVFDSVQNAYLQIKKKYANHGGSFNFPGINFDVSELTELQEIIKLCQADQKQNLKEFYMRQISHCDPKVDSDDSKQYRFHVDKFFPNYKIWFYAEEMTLDLGPTACFIGSNKNSIEKMRWFYETSIHDIDREWSRASLSVDNYLEQVKEKTGCEEEKIFCADANTFIIIDTRTLHRRTPAAPGTKRYSLRGILPRIEKS